MPMTTDEQTPVCNPSPEPVDELHLMKTAGIIEVAVRNPNVMEYMRYWEDRAEKAEAEVIALREAAQKVVDKYPVAAGTAKLFDPEEKGYGSIRNLRAVLGENE